MLYMIFHIALYLRQVVLLILGVPVSISLLGMGAVITRELLYPRRGE